MNILVIEDDKIKLERLVSFLNLETICIKESYHSGLRELIQRNDIDLLLLDMSLPLWEGTEQGAGENNEQFGGTNILRELKRRKKDIPVILVTMFDVFADGSLTFQQLNTQLAEQYAPFYKGGVFYNASEDKWKHDLENLVNQVKKELNDKSSDNR